MSDTEILSLTKELPEFAIKRKRTKLKTALTRYGFFLSLLGSLLLASAFPRFGGAKGAINGNLVMWYFAIPLTYLEAGLCCSATQFMDAFTNCYVLCFTIFFMYIVTPLSALSVTFLLSYFNINIWLLKGMEVLYCMPPPFNTSLVLSRLVQADFPTSIVTTLVCHFSGLLVSPVLLHIMIGASTPPLVEVNLKEILYSTILPLGIGLGLKSSFWIDSCKFGHETRWISQSLLVLTLYHWFCDAISADISFVEALDVLVCVLIACLNQLLVTWLCWALGSRWLTREVLLSALFTSTQKSVSFGGWLLRGVYRGPINSPMFNLPLVVLPITQIILGSLLASYLAPKHNTQQNNSSVQK